MLLLASLLLTAPGLACEFEADVRPEVIMGAPGDTVPLDVRAVARVDDELVGERSQLELLIDDRLVAGTPSRVDLQDGTGVLSFRPDAHLPADVDILARLTVDGTVADEVVFRTEERLAQTVGTPRVTVAEVLNFSDYSDVTCADGFREVVAEVATAAAVDDWTVVELYVVSQSGASTGIPASVAWIPPGELFMGVTTWSWALDETANDEVCLQVIHVDAAGTRSAPSEPTCIEPTNLEYGDSGSVSASCDHVGWTVTPWAWLLLLVARRRRGPVPTP